ncbi:MAG: hypothetical protein AAF806_31630, partial [Bacteroidota bacterium]
MNNIKEKDIFDKSKLALQSVFGEQLLFDELESSSGKQGLLDGVLKIASKKLSYSILNKPTIGRIERKVKAYNKINNNTTQNQPLFILDYASEELTQYFRKKNLFFIDAVGNCFINLPNLKIAVEGKKNTIEVTPNRRAFQKTGLKLIFQILQSPGLVSLNYREIAQQTGISLASVGYVLDELKEDGFLIAAEKQKRRLS